jgi:plasmid stability protein
MSDFLIRGLDSRVRGILERRAAAAGRSLQSEIKAILEASAHASDVDAARELADSISAELAGRRHPDSAALVRRIRDR